jgi:hypothetical protein
LGAVSSGPSTSSARGRLGAARSRGVDHCHAIATLTHVAAAWKPNAIATIVHWFGVMTGIPVTCCQPAMLKSSSVGSRTDPATEYFWHVADIE